MQTTHNHRSPSAPFHLAACNALQGDTPALLEALRKARLTALVVGPGLGVDTPQERAQLEAVLKWGRSEGLPMVIDGSALRHLAKVTLGGDGSCIVYNMHHAKTVLMVGKRAR